jgi:hypothetical protein
MTPFRKVQRDIITPMLHRQALLAHPCEFFRGFFNGRVPTVAEKLAFIEEAIQRMTAGQLFQNDTYIVEVIPCGLFVHLDIRRNDGGSCKNWREFQQIKNELVGAEHEAVELFPAESRLVDTANQYHLWVVANPSYRFPLGFRERFVLKEPMRVEQDQAGRLVAVRSELVPQESHCSAAQLSHAA